MDIIGKNKKHKSIFLLIILIFLIVLIAIFINFEYKIKNSGNNITSSDKIDILNISSYNAKVLEGVGAAKIIKNDELTGTLLNDEIDKIVLDKTLCEEMGKNALKISSHDVEDKIYKEIKKLVKN